MVRFLLSRLWQIATVVLLVCATIFILTNLLPGDPTVTILGEQASAAQRATARQQYGLDRPAPVRFVLWLGNAFSGDLGRSLRSNEPVLEMLVARIPVTLELAALSILIAIAIGLPAGIIAARARGTWLDVVVSVLAMTSVAIPYFWMGILLIMLFALKLAWLPPSGYIPFLSDPIGNLRLMILPALTIGTAFAALIMRQTRASLLQVMSQDYIRSARAKGLSEPSVLLHHGLRNALIPVVTVIGLQIGALLGGAVVTETVFSLPGLGRMMVDGIFQRDFPVIQGAILFIVLCVIAVNLFTDVLYAWLDPRVAA
jgi:peptide/nickel transport system permease protein